MLKQFETSIFDLSQRIFQREGYSSMCNAVTSESYARTRVPLDRELLRDLSTPAPARLLFQTGIEWIWIVVLAAAASWFSHPAVSIACMLLISTRQHALLVLMHEYSHYQFSRKHRWLNDLVGDVFTALPFFITIHGFRRNHMPHHRYAATEDDPNRVSLLKRERYRFPKTRQQVFIEILKHCMGWYTLADLKRYTIDAGMAVDLPPVARAIRVVCALGFAAVATRFDLWSIVLLYWIVPLSTFLMAILYLRDIGEHFGMSSPGIAGSRTVLGGPLERILICQNGVNFHTEHHLFPSVPFFRLERLHHLLMADSGYRCRAVVTYGYFSGLVIEATSVSGNAILPEEAL